jgi:hypothetical protein
VSPDLVIQHLADDNFEGPFGTRLSAPNRAAVQAQHHFAGRVREESP